MSSLDMSLDDLSKARSSRGGSSSRGGRGGSRGAGNGGAQQNGGGSGPIRNKQRHSGGGGAPRQQQQPYSRAPISTPLQYAAPIQNFAYAPAPQAAGQWKHDLYAAEPDSPQPQQQQPIKKLSGDTIHVSNLATDVSDEDVREIFERIGKVNSCVVNFNSSGKSTGTATVTFARKQDAEKAVEDYDEAEVDGRPMKLKLVGSVVSAPVVVKKQRPVVTQPVHSQAQLAYLPQELFQQQVAPLQFAPSYQQQPRAPKQQQQHQQQQQQSTRGGATRGGRGGRGGGASSSNNGAATKGASAATIAGSSRGGRGGASRGGRGGRGGAGGEKKEVSSEDLDREMESYHATREAAAAAPAPAAAGQPTTA